MIGGAVGRYLVTGGAGFIGSHLVHELERMGGVLCSCGSTNLAKGLRGYEARVSLRDGLERTVEWFKRHG